MFQHDAVVSPEDAKSGEYSKCSTTFQPSCTNFCWVSAKRHGVWNSPNRRQQPSNWSVPDTFHWLLPLIGPIRFSNRSLSYTIPFQSFQIHSISFFGCWLTFGVISGGSFYFPPPEPFSLRIVVNNSLQWSFFSKMDNFCCLRRELQMEMQFIESPPTVK